MSEGDTILQVSHLSVSFYTDQGEVQAVRDVSLSMKEGETLAVVGESGCGKSALCKSVMGLLPANAKIKQGSIRIETKEGETELVRCSERQMQRLRGNFFAMVFQNPLGVLTPTMSIGAQIAEAVRAHEPRMPREKVIARVWELMELVGIDRPKERSLQYPHQFSGGMRQRIVLAIALAGNPRILFADEPTTALDVTIQAQILELFRSIPKMRRTATVFVTHDLGVARRVADRVAVMYAGKLIEVGHAEEVFAHPAHPYTWGLLRALPAFSAGEKRLYAIPGMPPTLIDPPKGDAFACRNEYALAIDYEEEPPMFALSDTHTVASWLADERAPKVVPPAIACGGETESAAERTAGEPQKRERTGKILLDVRHVTRDFSLAGKQSLRAVNDVSLQIREGEIFGLVGESGCGKSTLARLIMNILSPDVGEIVYDGTDICDFRQFRAQKRVLQMSRQMIFQDCGSSLNPRMRVVDIIAEPLRIHRIKLTRKSLRDEAALQLRHVGMDAGDLDKYPAQLSGGQRQRVAIARALVTKPRLLVADEPLASLDVSIQAQIVNLFLHLQEEHGFTFLFIAHDLAMVEFLCNRVGVMHQGRLVESAKTHELFAHPGHPYTKKLLSAIPRFDGKRGGMYGGLK